VNILLDLSKELGGRDRIDLDRDVDVALHVPLGRVGVMTKDAADMGDVFSRIVWQSGRETNLRILPSAPRHNDGSKAASLAVANDR
jgi:hypothetical protein